MIYLVIAIQIGHFDLSSKTITRDFFVRIIVKYNTTDTLKSLFIFIFFVLREMMKGIRVRWQPILSCEVNTYNHRNFKSSWNVLCKVVEDIIFKVLKDNFSFLLSIIGQIMHKLTWSQGKKIKPHLSYNITASIEVKPDDEW